MAKIDYTTIDKILDEIDTLSNSHAIYIADRIMQKQQICHNNLNQRNYCRKYFEAKYGKDTEFLKIKP